MRILLVEDDLPLATAVAASLRSQAFEVHLVGSGEEAAERATQLHFDLVLLDIGLPGIDGLETLARLRRQHKRLPVILVTARDAVGDRIKGLDSGADDYLVKPYALDELAARVRVVARRVRLAHGTELEHGPLRLDCDAQRAWLGGQPLELTLREWRCLEALLRRVERVVSKQQLQEALGPSNDDVSYNAAEVYISRLRAKLEPSGVHIRTVRGFGYMLEEFKEAGPA